MTRATGSRRPCDKTHPSFPYIRRSSHVPVLRIFLMTMATWPFSIELSNLTMRMRQVQRKRSDRLRRMRPTARSGKVVLAKICLPGGGVKAVT